MSGAPARIWLCADDYGISPGVNGAIRDLIARRRINATSVMVVAPCFNQTEAQALEALRTSARAAIGLHVTLTAPFRPMSAGYVPTKAGAFPPLKHMFLPGSIDGGEGPNGSKPNKLDENERHAKVVREIVVQIAAFMTAFGRAPDFMDGHQHVQVFPHIRDAFLEVAKAKAPLAWVRQCGRILPLWKRFTDPKGLLLDLLSSGFRKSAAQWGIRTNPAFAGTYNFTGNINFAELFPAFLDGLPENSVVMCHPGRVDDELKRLDPLTTQREREYEYFADERFPDVLAAKGITLAT